jgi:phosphoglycolate phosphatase-like HAD superfamily hydrolase
MKTLIFDFDGTIADTLPFTVNNVLELNRSMKLLNAEKIDIEKFRSMDLSNYIKSLKIPTLKLLYFVIRLQIKLGSQIKSVSTFNDLAETLVLLKRQGVRTGIVTSNSKGNVKKFLEKNNLNYFDFIYTTINYFEKSRLIEKAIRKLKLTKADVIYIGDEVRDIDAARAAGIKIASVTWGYNLESVLTENKPDYLLNQPRDLLNLVQE